LKSQPVSVNNFRNVCREDRGASCYVSGWKNPLVLPSVSSLSTLFSITCSGHGSTEEGEGIRKSVTSFLLFCHCVFQP